MLVVFIVGKLRLKKVDGPGSCLYVGYFEDEVPEGKLCFRVSCIVFGSFLQTSQNFSLKQVLWRMGRHKLYSAAHIAGRFDSRVGPGHVMGGG